MKIEIKRLNKDKIEVKSTQEIIETKTFSITELQIQKDELQKRRAMDKQSFDNALAEIDEDIASIDGLIQELSKEVEVDTNEEGEIK